jgi:hypothetical protein
MIPHIPAVVQLRFVACPVLCSLRIPASFHAAVWSLAGFRFSSWFPNLSVKHGATSIPVRTVIACLVDEDGCCNFAWIIRRFRKTATPLPFGVAA